MHTVSLTTSFVWDQPNVYGEHRLFRLIPQILPNLAWNLAVQLDKKVLLNFLNKYRITQIYISTSRVCLRLLKTLRAVRQASAQKACHIGLVPYKVGVK